MMDSSDPTFNLEADLTGLMDDVLKAAMLISPGVPEGTLRRTIAATNLKALVQVILVGDDPNNDINVNLKMLCLGLLATADWLDVEGVTDAL